MARKGSAYYQQSAYAMTAVAQVGTMLAKRHPESPRIQFMLTAIYDAVTEFDDAFTKAVERQAQAGQRPPTPVVSSPLDTDRPGEER